MADKLRDDRIAKLNALRERGIPGYGGRFERSGSMAEILASYDPQNEGKPASSAGRIAAVRDHGKSAFLVIKDWSASIQVYLKKDKLGDQAFEIYKLLDLGDIIGVKGGLFKTRTGEVTIFADSFEVLTKSILPPPEKWHGLTDIEIRYRQRYLDLAANDDVMKSFLRRSEMVKAIRRFLDGRGFVEVETPMMQPIPGGAVAKPFITHHNALDIDLYLRIAPELYLKRLLVGGMEKVYEINRNFRNEGISTKHNPEFTMLEVYEAYSDLRGMMELVESMIAAAAKAVGLDTMAQFGDLTINLQMPFPREKYSDLMEKYAGVRPDQLDNLREIARGFGFDASKAKDTDVIDEVFKEKVEKNLVQPIFVIDYPVEMCPLTKTKADDPKFADRFEFFIAGMEMANAYSELNDPLDQERRFREQAAGHADIEGRVDEDFLAAMAHGMPPAGGLGVGIDRLAMILLGHHSIRDVILFPLLKP